mmetsp:Transcript_8186/g.25542  ORF Transcript_8186/g.25542 Transcript_8186/m.25542 type:complete len:337 (-) Transcript_8186:958-1968(-)
MADSAGAIHTCRTLPRWPVLSAVGTRARATRGTSDSVVAQCRLQVQEREKVSRRRPPEDSRMSTRIDYAWRQGLRGSGGRGAGMEERGLSSDGVTGANRLALRVGRRRFRGAAQQAGATNLWLPSADLRRRLLIGARRRLLPGLPLAAVLTRRHVVVVVVEVVVALGASVVVFVLLARLVRQRARVLQVVPPEAEEDGALVVVGRLGLALVDGAARLHRVNGVGDKERDLRHDGGDGEVARPEEIVAVVGERRAAAAVVREVEAHDDEDLEEERDARRDGRDLQREALVVDGAQRREEDDDEARDDGERPGGERERHHGRDVAACVAARARGPRAV